MTGGISNYRRALECLAACPAKTKLVIPGIHDVSLDPDWWEQNLDSDDEEDEPIRARDLVTLDDYTSCGVCFLEEGIRQIALRDGRKFKVYASQYTPSFGGYAFGYSPNEGRFNGTERRMPGHEDMELVMTHGPPRAPELPSQDGDSDRTYRLDLGGGHGAAEQQHLGCQKLWEAIAKVQPTLPCFRHIHEGLRGDFTVVKKQEPEREEDLDDEEETAKLTKEEVELPFSSDTQKDKAGEEDDD